ncbi:hypothetical protein PAECIP111892_02575 [Paenibacillus auburnensis]|uniref:Uncharacterized protein n=1 Tax=Paenibacillus auburnensis TaxID=2905649 RepID=A0ABM9C7S1_9BACL|nr:hypothetical protein [Paenibacillus auburnensis]CAH1204891.1 hypothetical protein PAECIP111892_02575 [Paenibacillus auburnensis]
MLPVHQRLAELYTISRRRPLSAAEITEQQHCLHANAVYCWEMGRLNNEALLAAQTEDTEWQQVISAQLFEVRMNGKAGKGHK